MSGRHQPRSTQPTIWTREEFERDQDAAVQIFRSERLEEPLEHYFDAVQKTVEALLKSTEDLATLHQQAVQLLTASHLQECLRYLASPPVSLDDLKTLMDSSLSRQALRDKPEIAERIINTILGVLDQRRFPWIVEARAPSQVERSAAITATAAMIAMRRTETERRTTGKNEQEERVAAALIAAGFTRITIPGGEISTIAEAPGPGQFCNEVKLGKRKADLVVGLWDRRIMPIECKVSNSATNSIKRLNNDAAAKAETWLKDFGALQIVPVAVLSGVYKVGHLQSAQDRGLTIYWAQQLNALIDWIGNTRMTSR
jgi:peptidyl-tRNA hydrolase